MGLVEILLHEIRVFAFNCCAVNQFLINKVYKKQKTKQNSNRRMQSIVGYPSVQSLLVMQTWNGRKTRIHLIIPGPQLTFDLVWLIGFDFFFFFLPWWSSLINNFLVLWTAAKQNTAHWASQTKASRTKWRGLGKTEVRSAEVVVFHSVISSWKRRQRQLDVTTEFVPFAIKKRRGFIRKQERSVSKHGLSENLRAKTLKASRWLIASVTPSA